MSYKNIAMIAQLTKRGNGIGPRSVKDTQRFTRFSINVSHTQVRASLANFTTQQASDVVIAYEPIWAIGTGRAATAEGAGLVIHLIRRLYGQMYGADAAATVRILYGGSVTSANISEFIAQPDIDGALVGGASLKPDFVEIVRKTVETMQGVVKDVL